MSHFNANMSINLLFETTSSILVFMVEVDLTVCLCKPACNNLLCKVNTVVLNSLSLNSCLNDYNKL